MAKKIKFALKLNDAEIQTLDSLQENFDLEKVTAYFLNGRLLTWLEDRCYENEAEKIRKLDKNSRDFSRQLCEALGVKYDSENDHKYIGVFNKPNVEIYFENLEDKRTYVTDHKKFENVNLIEPSRKLREYSPSKIVESINGFYIFDFDKEKAKRNFDAAQHILKDIDFNIDVMLQNANIQIDDK